MTPPGNALDFDGADDDWIASGAGVAQTPAVVSSPTHADVSYTTATLGASIASTGDTAIVERGIVWSTDFDFMPDAGTTVSESAGFYGTGVFSVAVSALPEDTTVYFRGIARDGSGDSYSEEASFTTLTGRPVIDSPTFASVGETSAELGGTLTSTGAAAVVERGITWSTDPGFGEGAGTEVSLSGSSQPGDFFVAVSGLPAETTIYYRLFAANGNGTNYSDVASFTSGTTPGDRIMKPSVQFTDPHTAVVRWTSPVPTDSIVEYGKSATLLERRVDGTLTTDHAVTLSNLQWRARYQYRIGYTVGGGDVFYRPNYQEEPSCAAPACPMAVAERWRRAARAWSCASTRICVCGTRIPARLPTGSGCAATAGST